MDKRILGDSGISVTRLCFGGLTIGPSQANLPLDKGADIVCHALNKGLNFIDTAELYDTYAPIREGIKKSGKFDTVIATKTYAYTREMAEKSFENARKKLDRDVIDIFLLHEQESVHTIKGHFPALEFLCEQKAKGKIRAVGISTHYISGALGACEFSEIEIIHPLFNMAGWGISDGGISDMEKAVKKAVSRGKGIYSMKALGGGNLIKNSVEALSFVISKDYIASVAVGMQSEAEIDANISFFETGSFINAAALSKINRRLHIEDWCTLCGKCVKRCKSGALSINGNKLSVNAEKCVLCSYCSAVCENMCLKVL